MAQGLALTFTYFGLWRTSKALNKSRAQDMKLPVASWVQLSFYVARIGAWYFKVIHGFVNPARFAWIR